jgi:hypothetical protein
MIDREDFGVLFLLTIISANAHGAGEITLVENSQPRAVVITTPRYRPAAQELVHYIQETSGARLPITATSAPAGNARILLGAESCPPEVRKELQDVPSDGYVIRSLPGNALALAGSGKDGTAFAVYAFLEKTTGIRWLWPGALGEYIPKNNSLRVGLISIREQPSFVWRNLGPGGALWGSMDKWTAERKSGVSEEHQRIERVWEKQNRFGGALIYGGHAMGEILSPAKYGATHPEYFALVNGKREWEHFDGKHGTQPCTTNPDVIRIVTDYARHFFDQHPDYEAFAISLNDGGGFCECDRCRRLDSGRVEVSADDPEGGKKIVITDRVVTFANRIAAAVAKTHPGKKLIVFAYGPYRQPPARVQIAPNLIIQYTFHASNNWNPAAEARQYKETGAWSGLARQLGIYEYFIQGNWPDLPRLMPEPIERSVRQLYEQGYRYYQTQAGDGYAINGLNYYILARLLWSPSVDVRSIQRDYVEKGFGRAAPAVTRYFKRWEDAWRAREGRPVGMDAATLTQYRHVAETYPKELRQAARRDLDEAAGTAQSMDRARVEFLRKGLQYVELTLLAVERTIPLLEQGWKFSPKVMPPGNPDMAAYRAARTAWEERDRYVESLKQDFVIAYFWIVYNDQNRSFVPLAKMREYRDATQ